MTDKRLCRIALCCFAILLAITHGGCGSGGTTAQIQPPPVLPDFTLTISPSSTTIAQGTTSSATQVSVQPLHGFSGDVQLTLSGMPSGVTSNPQGPFTVASGSSTTLLIGAASNAAIGSASISVQGVSGSVSHSASIALTIERGISIASRTTYARTDAQPAQDNPPGEPHHRHIAYDSAGHHLFVANRARNRVEIFSTQDASRVATVDITGASSADLSVDRKTVWVGTVSEQITAIDTGTLRRSNTFQIAGIVPIPNVLFDRPEELIDLSSGKLLVRLRQANGAESLLASWDPASNTLTDLTSLAPQIFQNGVGVMARSGDHTRVLAGSNDSTGSAMVLDGSANILTGAKTVGTGTLVYAAANADGSRFAAILASGSIEQAVLLDASLNIASTASVSGAHGLVFSSDAQTLYIAENENGIPVVAALATTDLHSLGFVPNPAIQGINSEIEAADETGLVFALANRGVTFLDASQIGPIAGPVPVFADAPAAAPSSGPNAGGTSVTLSGQNFGSNAVVRFGGQTVPVTSSNAGQIQATAPANTGTGAVNVSAYFPNGAIALAPDAFSYGPQILQVLPNTGSSAGGDAVAIYGYGFGEDIGKLSVKFGSSAATVQKIEDAQPVSASLGLDATYPFPVQRITVVAPAGAPGIVDIALTSPSGSATAKKSFQYLQSHVFAKPGFYKFILFDQKRQWIYLSNIDRVDVFDLNAAAFRPGILPPGGPPPNALIRQAALTPDASELVVADFGAQSVYLIQPDTAAGNAVKVGGIPGDPNSGPVRVAATSAQTVFVGLAAYDGGSSSCGSCLQQMNLSTSPVSVGPAPQPEISALTSAPLVEASGDGGAAYFSFATAPGEPMAGWNSATPGEFLTTPTNIPATDIAAAADGTLFASRNASVVEIREAGLALQSITAASELERIPQRTEVPGIALHPSGALVYVPFLTGAAPQSPQGTGLQAGVDIIDVHTGRLRLRVMLPEPLSMLAADVDGLRGKFLTVDENGERMFALTASGLTVIQLARVPLAFGTIRPQSASSSGGATLTIRGSGFQNGASVSIGGKPITVTFVDMNTLKVVLPALPPGAHGIVITNADGQTVSVDAAFTVN